MANDNNTTDSNEPPQDQQADTATDDQSDQAARPESEPATGDEDRTDWKAEARKWQERARKNAKAEKERGDLATRLKEFEDRDKTELQRAQEAQQQAEILARESEAKLTRYQVAAEKGLDSELVGFLPTGSREDMESAADTLLARMAAAREPRRPKPDPSQGTRDQPSEGSMNTLIRSGLGR